MSGRQEMVGVAVKGVNLRASLGLSAGAEAVIGHTVFPLLLPLDSLISWRESNTRELSLGPTIPVMWYFWRLWPSSVQPPHAQL